MKAQLQAKETAALVATLSRHLPILGSEEGLNLQLALALPSLVHLDKQQVLFILTSLTRFTDALPASATVNLQLDIAPSDGRIAAFLAAVQKDTDSGKS